MKMLRKMLALVLSLTMVMSLAVTGLWVGADPADTWNNATLGELSKLYETGRVDDPGIIATVAGDSGGKSYGTYMFASKPGTPHLFAHWCMSQGTNNFYYQFGAALDEAYHTGGDGCGAYFDAVWTQLAADYRSEFGNAQHDYVQDMFYNELVSSVENSARNFDIDNYSIALKNVFWSRAVQHGVSGAYNVISRALEALGGFKNQSEAVLIEAIYAESSKLDATAQNKTMSGVTAKKYGVDGKSMTYYSANSGDVQLGVYRRLAVNERSDALVMLQNNGYKYAPLADGFYSLRPLSAQSMAIDYNNGLTVTNTTNDGTGQKFSLSYHYGGFYTIETVPTATTSVQRLTFNSNGTPALATPSPDVGQLWVLESSGSGFVLKNKATGTYLMAPANNLVSEEQAQAVAATSEGGVLATSSGSVCKTAATQKSVAFTMTAAPVGTYTVYSAAEGGEVLTTVTATLEGSTLNLTSTGDDLASKDYYVSVIPAVEEGSPEAAESARIKLTVVAYEETTPVTPTVWYLAPFSGTKADWTMRGMIYPNESTVLHAKQSSFPVRGVISCSNPITKINLKIVNSTIDIRVTPNSTIYSYDLKKLDDSVPYSSLAEGTYYYVLTATAGNVVTELINSKFTVGAAISNVPSTGNDETFTITFNADGGTLYKENGSLFVGNTMTVSLDDIVYGEIPTPSLAGHKFLGWYAADGTQIVPTTPVRASDLTVTARYAKIYTYKFLNEDGSVFDEGSVATGELIAEPLNVPVKGPTYVFSHWKNYTAGKTVMGNAPMTFTPVFVPVSDDSGSNNNTNTNPTPGDNNNNNNNNNGTTKPPSSDDGGDNDSSTTTPSSNFWAISPGTSISQMSSPVYQNGKVVSDGNLATGMTTTVDGKEYVISVKGDTSGDGKVTVTDVVKLQSHLLNKNNLSGAYLKAADLNSDGKVSITDLVKSARVVAGKDSIR